jgi:hypothetical protein
MARRFGFAQVNDRSERIRQKLDVAVEAAGPTADGVPGLLGVGEAKPESTDRASARPTPVLWSVDSG